MIYGGTVMKGFLKALRSAVSIQRAIAFLLIATGLGLHQVAVKADIGPKGGPGDVPTPFVSNEKVELADGEIYTLIGRFVIREGNLWFQVDLEAHPWLANQKRKDFPFYRVIGTRVDLEPVAVRAERVQALMKAEGAIVERDLRPLYRLGVEVLESPTVPNDSSLVPNPSPSPSPVCSPSPLRIKDAAVPSQALPAQRR
jgi:hypothetical protein